MKSLFPCKVVKWPVETARTSKGIITLQRVNQTDFLRAITVSFLSFPLKGTGTFMKNGWTYRVIGEGNSFISAHLFDNERDIVMWPHIIVHNLDPP